MFPSRSLMLFLFLSLASGQSVTLPRFRSIGYRAYIMVKSSRRSSETPNGSSGADQRCFGGDPERYAAERVNFAGHFVMGSCGCGSGCHYLFMWDAITGEFHPQFPFGPINIGRTRWAAAN